MTPTTPSPISDQAAGERVKEFEALCDLIPEDAYWGMPLTPDLVRHIRDCSAAPTTGSAPEIKPIGYVTQYALTHVLAHGGNIPMHPEPLSLANVPVYLAAPASPAASALTDEQIKMIAMGIYGIRALDSKYPIEFARGILAASMGGHKS